MKILSSPTFGIIILMAGMSLISTVGAATASTITTGVTAIAAPPTLPEPVLKEIAKDAPNLARRGEAVMRFIGIKVYDIRLWTASMIHTYSEPFALELVYDLGFKGKDIADRSVTEMRRQGYNDETKLKRWGEMMGRIFPDIRKGDTLIGVSIPGKEIRFYTREKFIAAESDMEFAKAFFDIWLSEKTSEPKLRQRLLGLN